MLYQVLNTFNVVPDIDLNLMTQNQTLTELTSRLLLSLDNYIKSEKPDIIVVQGDTTTVFCASLVAFYNKIPVAHIEAGLRTNNIYSPWPEEANRQLVSRLTNWHFCPTESNKQNLIKENINPSNIYVVGNTVIDALLLACQKIKNENIINPYSNKYKKHILITGHRRENFGTGFENICTAIKQLALDFKNTEFVYPVHLNPNVQNIVTAELSNISNIRLIPPQDYLSLLI